MRRMLVAFIVSLGLAGCGPEHAGTIDDGAPDEVEVDESPLSLSCVLGASCPQVTTALAAVAPRQSPTASTQNAGYWVPDAPAGRNVQSGSSKAAAQLFREKDDDGAGARRGGRDAGGHRSASKGDMLLAPMIRQVIEARRQGRSTGC